jgi:hypothetical protein
VQPPFPWKSVAPPAVPIRLPLPPQFDTIRLSWPLPANPAPDHFEEGSMFLLWGTPGRALSALALIAAIVFCVPSIAGAQAATGTLLGNVRDESGGTVPGATITLTEVQTGIRPASIESRVNCRGSRSSCARAWKFASTPPFASTCR